MRFQELLDCYMQRLDCSGRELAEASGLSAAIISRYRSGSRLPSSRSDSLDRLADGLAKIAEKRGEALTAAEIQSALEKSLEREKQPALNAENLAALMAALEISPAELALALSYDISYISRVRSGQRNPADAAAFAEGVGSFVEQRYTRKTDRQQLAGLLGCPEEQLREDGLLRQALRDWLLQERSRSSRRQRPFSKSWMPLIWRSISRPSISGTSSCPASRCRFPRRAPITVWSR